jgi:competence protein ComFC
VLVNETAVAKVRDTPELKDVFDYGERIKLLESAFQTDPDAVRGRRILLIDDLYRSGATATVVAQALLSGGAATVHMLAMTKTRTRT